MTDLRIPGRESRRTRLWVAFAFCALLVAVSAPRSPAAPSDTVGSSTLQKRIVPASATGFSQLTTGPGEPQIVRQELGAAQAGREARRSSLAYFGQLSDFQLADEESPARVEFLDVVGPPLDAAWRPWEAMESHIDDATVRQMNAFAPASPVPNGDGTRRHMDFTIVTGDSADSQQFNETDLVKSILEGGRLDPNSGINPAGYGHPLCPPAGVPGAAEAAKYTGVQDYDDYNEAGFGFYDPNVPAGSFSTWPDYGELMDAAQKPFAATGLRVPSYVAFGNHDALVQGNQAALQPFEQIATGCVKPLSFSLVSGIQSALQNPDPAVLQNLLATLNPSESMLVPPDPDRRFVSKQQYKGIFQEGSQADGHGFDYVEAAQNAASNQSAGYYSWSPLPKFRFIALDTTCDAGVIGPSSDGNIDHPQFQWLEGQLRSAQAAGKYAVLFSHHAIQSLTCNLPDESAPSCSAPDAHGHDSNPGCDVDPRSSSPIHLGADLTALLHRYPNAIAWVAGHSHVNDIVPFPDGGGAGFWMIRTAAEADWPQQSRLLEVFDNKDGTLSIFGTILDHAGTVTAPGSVTNLANPDPLELASIGRTLAYNDPQAGGRGLCSTPPCGEGAAKDRNVELLLRNPLPSADANALKKGPCANRKNGTPRRDRLRGTKQGDRLLGRGGRDKAFGLKGRDCLKGERGRDKLKGGPGADSLAGGRGADKLVGGRGRDRLKGGAGSDRLISRGGGRDKVRCGQGPNDVAVVDRRDRPRGCETVRRPRKRG